MPVRVPAKASPNKFFFFTCSLLAFFGKPLFALMTGLILFVAWLAASITRLAKSRPSKPRSLKRTKSRFPVKKALAFAFSTFIFLAVFFWTRFIFTLPRPGQLVTRPANLSTKIYDSRGRLLYKIYSRENRTPIKLADIPVVAKQATIAIEDAEFYSHHGFSLRGIMRSLRRNLTQGEKEGGSTITQQLVKNTLLTPEKTFSRKVKEIVLAVLVEFEFSKDQILEMYLNEVSYGGSSRGVEEASELYFGKGARDLSLAESALLAGLPKAPTTYSPFGANPKLARARQLEVLSRMVQEGYITQTQAEEAASQKLAFAPQKTNIKAPHFIMYVKQLLVEKYGEQAVEQGGLSVYTSLDLDVQEMAEKVVRSEVDKIASLGISNGAALVTAPKTGQILALVGSKNYFDSKIDGNFNVTTALRQPGSSIKPVNYSYALESKKYTSASVISDSPVTYVGAYGKPYSPRNYDNTYHGPVSLRTALASSLNVPAVEVLASYGVEHMIEQGRKLGITTWNTPERYGLSITLGGAEVKLTDMAVVYGTFANGGEKVDLHPILKVVDSKGNVLEDNPCSPTSHNPLSSLIRPAHAEEATPAKPCTQKVLESGVAFVLTSILSDNNARSLAFGTHSLLAIPNHPEVAVKTGTTQNLRDNLAIGYTKDFVVLTWVGNNNNKPMAYVASGITGATPIWYNIFVNLLRDRTSVAWTPPEDVVAVSNCGWTEYFLEGTQRGFLCYRPKEEKKEDNDKILQGAATEQSITPQ